MPCGDGAPKGCVGERGIYCVGTQPSVLEGFGEDPLQRGGRSVREERHHDLNLDPWDHVLQLSAHMMHMMYCMS